MIASSGILVILYKCIVLLASDTLPIFVLRLLAAILPSLPPAESDQQLATAIEELSDFFPSPPTKVASQDGVSTIEFFFALADYVLPLKKQEFVHSWIASLPPLPASGWSAYGNRVAWEALHLLRQLYSGHPVTSNEGKWGRPESPSGSPSAILCPAVPRT